MIDWVRSIEWGTVGPILIGVSVALMAASVVGLPIILLRLPPDYLARMGHGPRCSRAKSVLRNAAAVLLALLGVAMLVLPGQGLLTILAAVVVSDFRGKHKVVRAILGRPGVLRAVNALRRRAHKPPLQPHHEDATPS